MSCPNDCDVCDDKGCLSCESPLLLYNYQCVLDCPPYTYPTSNDSNSSNGAICANCDSNCLTCSGPDPKNCTLCQSELFLFNQECLSECPFKTAYETKLNISHGVEVPICALKTSLTMKMKYSNDPRQVFISFSSPVENNYLNHFLSNLEVTLQGATLDSSLFVVKIYDESTLNLTLLVQRNIPNLASLQINLQLSPTFNYSPTNKYMLVNTTAEIELAEYYPYTQAQKSLISSTSQAATSSAAMKTIAQAVTTVLAGSAEGIASAAASSFLMQFRLTTDLIQLLQFLDIQWPSNVMDLFRQAYIDPSNLVLPVCFIPTPPQDQLSNITLSKVLQLQQISPLFFVNNCEVFSTMTLLISFVIGLKIFLTLNKPSFIPEKISRFGHRLDKFLAWNFVMQIFISNYPLYLAYSLLQLYYSSFENLFEGASFLVALVSSTSCIAFVLWMHILAWKYSKIKRTATNEEMQKYQRVDSLFQGIKTTKKSQFFLIPLSMARVSLLMIIAIAMAQSSWASSVLFCILQGAFLCYLLKYRPHTSKFEFASTLIAESMLFTVFLCAFGMKIITSQTDERDEANRAGWAIIFINFGVSMVTLSVTGKQIIEELFGVYKKIRASRLCNRSRRRQKILPILINNTYPTDPSSPAAEIMSSKESNNMKNSKKTTSQPFAKFKKTVLDTVDDIGDTIQFQISPKISTETQNSATEQKATEWMRLSRPKSRRESNNFLIPPPLCVGRSRKSLSNRLSNPDILSSPGTIIINSICSIHDTEYHNTSSDEKQVFEQIEKSEEPVLPALDLDCAEDRKSSPLKIRKSITADENSSQFSINFEKQSLTMKNVASTFKYEELEFPDPSTHPWLEKREHMPSTQLDVAEL